jgi:hypothetical protein
MAARQVSRVSDIEDHDDGIGSGAEHPAAGYGHPPIASRFTKGRSGNPAGRPKNRHQTLPHNAVLSQMVTVRDGGRERRITAAEAFLLQLTRKGLAGDSAAARASLDAIEAARARRPGDYQPLKTIAIVPIKQGTSTLLDTLGIAIKKYPKDEARVRWELNPWIVEAALARLGKRRLTEDEQREVWANTRTPHKVRWPAWWVVRG